MLIFETLSVFFQTKRKICIIWELSIVILVDEKVYNKIITTFLTLAQKKCLFNCYLLFIADIF